MPRDLYPYLRIYGGDLISLIIIINPTFYGGWSHCGGTHRGANCGEEGVRNRAK